MSHLFDPLAIRDITFANRVFVSPMYQYSSTDGYASDWHFVHLGSRAVGGAGLVLTEATGVLPEGRISPQDLGIWMDDHIEPLARIVRFIQEQGSVAGMQLAHAGRKASTYAPWAGHGMIPENKGGWNHVVAPSALAFTDGYPMPRALSIDGIQNIVSAFAAAARRACEAGFRVIEIHAAHGYLIQEFLSPLSNQRTDAYGGSFENRTRVLREIVAAVRGSWPERAPLFVRLSATDWIEGGWDIQQSVELARQLKQLGADLIDCSFWRECTGRTDTGRAGLSNAVCGADPPGSQHPDRCGGDSHIARSGRAHSGYRTGRRSDHRARTPARPVLAVAGSA
jgi:2,4-dienoyl-CoA reductase-like NADH-dependent reductase (Old Yellow Enzyme family)